MSWTHEYTCTLEASPGAVFSALTDASELKRWFAEHVDLAERADGPFRFWGRHTLDTPAPSMATQRLTHWLPERALGFTWRIGGVETDVAFDLAKDGKGSRLVLNHSVVGSLPFPRERELIDDHWRFALGNLAAHLAGGRGIVLPDFTDPSPTVRQTLLINAPRTVVFRALITPALINQWFDSESSTVDARVGGRYDLAWKYQVNGTDVAGGPTRILEYEENERLTLDWPDWRGDASVTGQTITFQLESVSTQTRVTFVHAGFERTTDIGDYPFGWSYFVGKLKTVVEGAM